MRGLFGSIEMSCEPARSTLEERPFPGRPPSVVRKTPRSLVRAPGVAERGDVDDSGFVGMDLDLADVAGVLQPDIAPGAAAVVGPVDPVAVRDVAADRRFAGPGVDDVGIGLGDGERPDRRGLEEAVGDVAPR